MTSDRLSFWGERELCSLEYLPIQVRECVRFYDIACEMIEDGTEVFIEAGRGKVLSNLLKKNKGGDYEVYPLGDMKMCELFKERVSRGIDFGRLANKKSSKFYTG